MVLIVERREPTPAPAGSEPGPRSVERALQHMHWHFVPADKAPPAHQGRTLGARKPHPSRRDAGWDGS